MDEQVTEQDKLEFETFPGADKLEERDKDFSLNFGLDDEGNPTEEEPTEEVVDEATEETVAEAEESAEEDVSHETSEVETAEEAEQPEEEVEEEVAELEEEPAPDPEPAPEPKQKGQTVPKSRLDDVIKERNELRREMEAMKESQKPPAPATPAYDFEAKEKAYQDAVLDGETEKAKVIRAEINEATRAQLSAELTQEVERTVNRKNEESALQIAADKLQTDFPVFNQDSSDYDEAMTQEVIDLRDAFIVKGDRPVDALAKASQYVISTHNISAPQPEESTGLAGKAAPPKKAVDEVATQRKKKAQVAQKLDAASKQPPELPGESSSNHGEKALDISSLSEEEFNALPEATLKRLRGDIL